jgi:hypothetical protein
MTERQALRYRNLLIDTEKAINEILNLYSNDGAERLNTFTGLFRRALHEAPLQSFEAHREMTATLKIKLNPLR